MQLGIIGLPGAGKTTIFNALTGEQAPTGVWGAEGRLETHTAVVDVPDDRLTALSERFSPPKTTHAKVTCVDIGGIQIKAGREGLPSSLLNQLEQVDGLVHVVRAFENPDVPHVAGSVDAARDVRAMEDEFLLHDMLVVERRLERLAEERQRGGRERSIVDREIAFFERLATVLGRQEPLRPLQLAADEQELLVGFGFLSRKPLLVVANLAEGQALPALAPLSEKTMVIGLQGKLEMELAQLAPDELHAFLRDFGLEEPGRDRMLEAAYQLLGLISFFTINERELRAWALEAGSTALQAAHTIHSDLARGFIRAEVIGWQELIQLGGLAEARNAGRLRVEGKDYPVCDGDVIYIRFNV